jgi:DNA-binding transcriptional LysR family regulator
VDIDIDPNDLLLFARIAESGSFTRAAARVGLPKSTLSRRISNLEALLGERLLLRTTRKLVLTEFGLSLLEHARQVVEQTEAAAAMVQHRQAEPSGRLRISMPPDLASGMEDMFGAFMERYPAVRLEIDLSPRRVDLVSENFDLAIRMGDLPDDASLAARRIVRLTTGLYAAPTYIARRGLPESPDDLQGHDLLCILARSGSPMAWQLRGGKSGSVQWERPQTPRALANSPELLVRMARRGAGITAVSDQYVLTDVKRGALVRVLPDWRLPDIDGWAVFPGRRLMPAKTRVFLDLLEASFDAECRVKGDAPALQ